MHADRGRSRGRQRVLYFFRTPPGVKVGRAALDEDAIRLLEEHNPEIEFDWTRILKGQGDPVPERRRERGGQPPGPERREPPPARQKIDPVEPTLPAAAPPAPVEPPTEPATAAEARLGAEGVSRLRGRYAEMLARISERITDPERQTELKTLAERLNPDAWVTADDVTAGLDTYEATFESLRGVVGHRRRRRQRRPAEGAE